MNNFFLLTSFTNELCLNCHKIFVMIFCYFCLNSSVILRSIQRYIVINVYMFSCYSCHILIKLEIFKKSSNTKFHEKSSIGSRVYLCGQTYRRTNKREERIVAFVIFESV